jgi:hypothetical protein
MTSTSIVAMSIHSLLKGGSDVRLARTVLITHVQVLKVTMMKRCTCVPSVLDLSRYYMCKLSTLL